MKQDKSTNYSLLGRGNSNLKIGTNLSKSVEKRQSYGLQMVCVLSFQLIPCIEENLIVLIAFYPLDQLDKYF